MKKSELTQLTQIIEHIVAKEVRKQLPAIIAETFQNMMGRQVVSEQRNEPEPIQEQVEPQEPRVGESPTDFKASLRELFAGTPVMKTPPASNQPRPVRQFAKDPILNQILNETTSDLRDRERLVGAAAYAGGYSPGLTMVPGFNPDAASSMPMEEEPTFARNMPSMAPPVNAAPRSRPQVFQEGMIPSTPIPDGVPAAVKGALTRNYSSMMKLIDKKKKGIA